MFKGLALFFATYAGAYFFGMIINIFSFGKNFLKVLLSSDVLYSMTALAILFSVSIFIIDIEKKNNTQ